MKRSVIFILMPAVILLIITASYDYFSHRLDPYPFRCSTFAHYDLSRKEGKVIEFTVAQNLRFESKESGYLLLNGQAVSGDQTTIFNRRVVLSSGAKIDYDTYRYAIGKIITASTDTTPDSMFTLLLAEIALGPSYLQLDINKIDNRAYLIGGPLSYLFTCQRY